MHASLTVSVFSSAKLSSGNLTLNLTYKLPFISGCLNRGIPSPWMPLTQPNILINNEIHVHTHTHTHTCTNLER